MNDDQNAIGDRRKADRRMEELPIEGPERRTGDRRSGTERRRGERRSGYGL